MIDRESPVPLYYQLKQLLVERIASGEWQPGYMLPTEEQLQEQYGLSRTTVRQAMKEMEFEGQITRHRGRGTFVSKPKISHNPDPRFNLTAYLTKKGMQPGWQVIAAEWVAAQAEEADRLDVDVGADVYRLRRLRLANNEPIGYHIAHVVRTLGQNIDKNHLDQGGSLSYLEDSGYLRKSYANRTIQAVLASEEVAGHLGIKAGSPILMIRRRIFNSEGSPVEDMRAMYRGDRFQYQVHQWPRQLSRQIQD